MPFVGHGKCLPIFQNVPFVISYTYCRICIMWRFIVGDDETTVHVVYMLKIPDVNFYIVIISCLYVDL